ncbi:MAG: crossover junction endodeoxyribonuclease RuvC [Gammaproteobacteria bacterium]|nr:crossover junction endodeoxyribonuclease RuvC [Gammaproteobacteria bacterium]
MRILGIDPGSRITGFGIIDSDGRRSVHVASGCIRTADGALPARLQVIYSGVQELMTRYRPAAVAVEQVFLARNADSALKLGQARSAAICGTFTRGVESAQVFEYAARAVKQAIVGLGQADKAQVSHMVAVLLNHRDPLQVDAADALAVALCHAHTRPLLARLARLSPALAPTRTGAALPQRRREPGRGLRR